MLLAAPGRVPGKESNNRDLAGEAYIGHFDHLLNLGLILGMENVLYDATAWYRWLLQLLARMGLHTRYRAFDCLWRQDYFADVCCGRRDFWEALRAMLLSAGLSPGQIDEVVAAGHSRHRELDRTARALPGVVATVMRLDALGLPMAVVSNCPCSGERLEAVLDGLGLGGRFQAVVSSADLGRVKPDPTAYQAALFAMGLEADQVAFVGHDAAELAGAADLGMRTVAFNHEHDALADVYLDRFDQLSGVVEHRSLHLLAG